MKKILFSLFCGALLIFALASCGGNEEPHEHQFGSYVIESVASCTEDGVKTQYCDCGEERSITTEAYGHSFAVWEIVEEATCTTTGIEESFCVCGEKETRTVPKKAHTFGEWYNLINATCTAYGKEERICSCGEKETNTIIPTGHTFTEWTVTKEATCTEEGTEERSCVCGEKETKTISLLEHNYVDGLCTMCKERIGIIQGVVYDISSDGTYAEVIGYNGGKNAIIIDDVYKGLPVKNIYDEAFAESSITSVFIPDTVTNIGEGAFYYCENLESVTLSNNLTYIGYRAFYHTSIKSVKIPNTVNEIDMSAFSDCKNLKEVTISNGNIQIGRSAFSYCNDALYEVSENLKYVGDSNNPYAILIEVTGKNFSTYNINEKTQVIAEFVFEDCKRLTEITIPVNIKCISNWAFDGCTELQGVFISDLAAWCKIRFCSNPLRYANKLYLNENLVTDLVIPDSVTSIGNSAFDSCTSLASITIPDSVTSIGQFAFYSCSSLTDVYYTGREEEWSRISIGEYNTSLKVAAIHCNYAGE